MNRLAPFYTSGAPTLWKEASTAEVVFTRSDSVADVIESLIHTTKASIDAALYRFNSQQLARVLNEARRRRVRIRLVIDRRRYEGSPATRQLLYGCDFSFRLAYGRDGPGSKMHHKFVLLDGSLVLTGSYNWTLASEQKNYENLVILKEPRLLESYRREFEKLWTSSEDDHRLGAQN